MTDTPRDPLPLTDEEIAALREHPRFHRLGLDRNCIECFGWGTVGRLLATLDASRPSGDEALREAVQFLPEMVGEPNPEGWSLVRRKDVLALLGEPR